MKGGTPSHAKPDFDSDSDDFDRELNSFSQSAEGVQISPLKNLFVESILARVSDREKHSRPDEDPHRHRRPKRGNQVWGVGRGSGSVQKPRNTLGSQILA
jgi:hypothetical protein